MKKLSYILILALVALTLLCACTPDEAPETPTPGETQSDEEYTLEIYGITTDVITVTKAQIKALGETKAVEYTDDNPCYASDKTDDDGNLIPHTLKGVYLDDILDEYADGILSASFYSITLEAEDGYWTLVTNDVFNEDDGGNKVIIAYEYDGHVLDQTQKSGSLRAVIPNQNNGAWVKKLKKVTLGFDELTPPDTEKLIFMEFIGEQYYDSVVKEKNIGGNTVAVTYYGISLEKLLDAEILQGETSDKMFISAWDYVTNGTTGFYREYKNLKIYDHYSNAFLAFRYQEGEGEMLDYERAPLFTGENILDGMSVKNTLSVSVGKTALMSLQVAYEKFDENSDDKISFGDILTQVNLPDDETYAVFDTNGTEYQITGAVLKNSTLEKSGANYVLKYGDNTLNLKSIEIK
ncbi:MAG: molybdopterin-dependent oxidoreductase [Christensenellales bacterium]|jgi:hypothetical protein